VSSLLEVDLRIIGVESPRYYYELGFLLKLGYFDMDLM